MARLLHFSSSNQTDAAAREQALDVERSWIVEAPAGSGKTGLLIQRYLRLLGHSSVTEPEQVLAITFTKAATEEIRERIHRELQRARELAEPKTDFERKTTELAKAVLLRDQVHVWRLLEDPRRLRVRTIDAVCAEITRSLPISCGGGASLVPVEDASSLYYEASRRTWLRLGGNNGTLSEALRSLLLHRDGDLQAGISLVANMLAERQQWGSLIPLREEQLDDNALDTRFREQLDRSLERVVCEGLSRLARAFPELTLQRLAGLANSLSERPGYRGQLSPLAVCRELRESPGEAAEHLHQWRALAHLLIAPSSQTWRKGFNKNHLGFEPAGSDVAQLKQIVLEVESQPELLALLVEIGDLPPARFPAEQWPITKALLHVLRAALIELQLVFDQTGRSDFVEPALLAGYALEDEGARLSLGASSGMDLMHLLVDEMQDTSTKQYELIERLTNGWADEQKTIFLVGDPKQSIYLFRHARVERFVETMRTGRIGNVPIGLLQLTANFRSQAGLVDAFNQDFKQIFPRIISRPEDVNYVQAVPTRQSGRGLAGDSGAAWHISVIAGSALENKQGKQARLLQNAREIRRVIEAWRNTPLPQGRSQPWKLAVLVQSRQNLRTILPEFRADPPLPFRALKIDTLDTRQEILDLLSLTRALLHPADRVAWLAVLRAPWCGLSLTDLHALTGQDEPAYLARTVVELVERLGAELSPDGTARLERVWPVLSAATLSIGDLRVPERVERTWQALGGASFLDEVSRQNAHRFLDLLRTLDREEGEVRLSNLTVRLKRLFAAPGIEPAAVDLVTIHGSKGLEWDVVLVPELERSAPRRASQLFEWEELPNGEVILAPITAKGEEATALNTWLRGVRARRETSERKRLFYVACTRAREELHLFGIANTKQDGTVTAPSGSILQAAWPAAQARLATVDEDPLPLPLGQQGVFDLAASAEKANSKLTEDYDLLERLPLSFKPDTTYLLSRQAPKQAGGATPEERRHDPSYSSYAKRCLGSTIHLFLEETANSLMQGTGAASLLAELPTRETQIYAVLRAHGLPLRTIEHHTQTVLRALRGTLTDPMGQWLLGGRSEAHNEFSLTTLHERVEHYRIDRIFRAGSSPQECGNDYVWLVDYKTATYNGDSDDEDARQDFLEQQKRMYEPQLRRYSQLIGEVPVRLALWFPLMKRLVWWTAEEQDTLPDGPGFVDNLLLRTKPS